MTKAENEQFMLLRDELKGLKNTVIATIGGVDYEGFPTSELNYLQRLRILVAIERLVKAKADESLDGYGVMGMSEIHFARKVLKEALDD